MTVKREQRTETLTLTVTKAERERICRAAVAHDMTFSDYMRRVLAGKIKVEEWTNDE